MHRNRCPWCCHALATVGLLVTATPISPAGEPPAPGPAASINVFLKAPVDLGALGETLAKPDYVILRGDEYARLLARPGGPGGTPPGPWNSAVGSVAVGGEVRGELADLTVEFGVDLLVEGPAWVPLRLDGLTLSRVREGERDLFPRQVEGGGWQVELSGRGKHAVRVSLLAPVRQTAEGRRLELAVPEAPSTRLAVEVPKRATDASTGPGEPLGREPSKEGLRTQLTGVLTPRSKVVLVWKVEDEPGSQLPPLLVAQGEIAVDVDPGSFRTRSSWSIRSLRGSARTLELRFDPEDEVLELELDGQPPPRRDRAGRRLDPDDDPAGRAARGEPGAPPQDDDPAHPSPRRGGEGFVHRVPAHQRPGTARGDRDQHEG